MYVCKNVYILYIPCWAARRSFISIYDISSRKPAPVVELEVSVGSNT